MVNLWIDDEREPPGPEWLRAENSELALGLLELTQKTGKIFEIISFGYDLGLDEDQEPDDVKHVVRWMIQNDYWPDEIQVHSEHAKGREWITGTFNRTAPSRVKLAWNN